MEKNFENKILNKKNDLNSILETFRHTADALGFEIDPEALKSVALLNTLGYYTEASCAGHLDHGFPYAWFDFGTEVDKRESELKKQHQSVYWDVYNNARNIANKTIEEKFPNHVGLYTDEINNLWDDIFMKEKEKHPKYGEFQKIELEIKNAVKNTRHKIAALVSEYNDIHPELTVSLEPRGVIRINCIPNSINTDNLTETEKEPLKEKSDKTLKSFEEFLINKYENLT
jgi:hypothetical protein